MTIISNRVVRVETPVYRRLSLGGDKLGHQPRELISFRGEVADRVDLKINGNRPACLLLKLSVFVFAVTNNHANEKGRKKNGNVERGLGGQRAHRFTLYETLKQL